MDALGRALKRGEVDGQDLGQERHSLLQQLRAAEQVLHEVPRGSGSLPILSLLGAGPSPCWSCPRSYKAEEWQRVAIIVADETELAVEPLPGMTFAASNQGHLRPSCLNYCSV